MGCLRLFLAPIMIIGSIVLMITLLVLRANDIVLVIGYIFFTISFLITLYALWMSALGFMALGTLAPPVARKYYTSVRWFFGAELLSWLTSVFTVSGVIYAIALSVCGHWWMIIYAVIAYLIYSNHIGPRLNPNLFLGQRARAGDFFAMAELQELDSLRAGYCSKL